MGGNAVNGVINIITKSTQDTLGSYGQIAYGQHGYQEMSARHGLQFNDKTTARAFYKAKDTFTVIDEFQHHYENDKVNTISTQTAGVKFDIEDGNTSWMLAFGGEKSEQYYDWYITDAMTPVGKEEGTYLNVESSSHYVQLDFKTDLSEKSSWNTNISYWHDYDNSPDAEGEFDTIDVDSVWNSQLTKDINILVGGGGSYTHIELQGYQDFNLSSVGSYTRLSADPVSDDFSTNVYAQISFNMNEYYSLDVGIKAEYFELNNTFELSPQIRGSYRYNDQHLWLGIGRAVVSPSYFELKSDYIVFYGDGIVDLFKANTEIKNERVLTIDAGYRLIKDNYSIDATAFISTYENVRGSDNTSSSTDAVWVYESNDDYEAKTYGAEVAIEWDINQSVKNHTSYSYLSFSQERVDGDLSAPNADDYWEIDHQNMISNQLLWQVTTTLQWDFVLNYKDIDYKDSYVDVDDLFSLNTRLGWQKHEHAPLVEVMINNIGMSSKCELETYTDDNSCRGYESEQSIYGRVSYEF